MKGSVIALSLLIAGAVQAAAPTVDEVGDPDSFGRDVIYLGKAQAPDIWFEQDCTPDPQNPRRPNDVASA
jgi:hypothetical protein